MKRLLALLLLTSLASCSSPTDDQGASSQTAVPEKPKRVVAQGESEPYPGVTIVRHNTKGGWFRKNRAEGLDALRELRRILKAEYEQAEKDMTLTTGKYRDMAQQTYKSAKESYDRVDSHIKAVEKKRMADRAEGRDVIKKTNGVP